MNHQIRTKKAIFKLLNQNNNSGDARKAKRKLEAGHVDVAGHCEPGRPVHQRLDDRIQARNRPDQPDRDDGHHGDAAGQRLDRGVSVLFVNVPLKHYVAIVIIGRLGTLTHEQHVEKWRENEAGGGGGNTAN